MKAREIMRKPVITLKPYMTVREAAKLFIDEGITGAPVVDDYGRIQGVLSQTDLVRRDNEASADQTPAYHRQGEESLRASGLHLESPDFTRVSEIMTPGAVITDEETPVEEIARIMLRRRIHRVLVTRQGKLAGIVTSMDLLKVLGGRLQAI